MESRENIDMEGKMSFRDNAYVHGVAGGLQEMFGISDAVYSLIVYGFKVPVNNDGQQASNMDDAVAVMAVSPPVTNTGVPYPLVTPVLDEDNEPYAIPDEKDDLEIGSIVSYYDSKEDATKTGAVIELNNDTAKILTNFLNDAEEDDVVEVIISSNDVRVPEINGTPIDFNKFEMWNEDDEHEKDWWRIEEIEEEIES